MSHDTAPKGERTWFDSSHASLCALGAYLRQIDFFAPLEARLHLKQKVTARTRQSNPFITNADAFGRAFLQSN